MAKRSAALLAGLLAGLIALAAASQAPAAFPGRNGKIVFRVNPGPTQTSDIFTVNGRGRQLRRLTGAGFDYTPAFSPGGRKIVFVKSDRRARDIDIWTVRPNGTRERLVVHTEGTDYFWPAFSPSGKRIVFSGNAPDSSAGIYRDIYSARTDGSHLRRLTRGTDGDAEPQFSPNGERIVFSRDGDIAVMRSDGSKEHRLTRTPRASEFSPTFSPSGKRIAYVQRVRNGPHEIYKMHADGSRRKQLTDRRGQGRDGNPAFSPNGRKIVFDRSRRGFRDNELYVMKRDGSDERALTNLRAASAFDPDWGVRP